METLSTFVNAFMIGVTIIVVAVPEVQIFLIYFKGTSSGCHNNFSLFS
jgi:hypothetical protein